MGAALQQKSIGRSEAPVPAPPAVRAATAPRLQLAPAVRVSKPSDPAEKEAESTAKKVMRMAAPETAVARSWESPYTARFAHLRIGRAAQSVARKDDAAPGRGGPGFADKLAAAKLSGRPMPASLKRFMEPRFRADFGKVRIHTGDTAAALNRQVGARAFAFGNQVFFGKDRFKPDTSEGKELIAHELTHTIQQGAAVQRSEDATVSHSVPEMVQGSWLSEGLDWVAGKANDIPGFRLFTLIIGINPINMSAVDRTPANVLRGLIELVPGGGLITRALDNHQIIDRAAAWFMTQIATLASLGRTVRDTLVNFVNSIGADDIFLSPFQTWDRVKRLFTGPIDQAKAFLTGLASGFVELIKDAILRPLGGLAQGLPGYDLLKAVLKKDPVTGEPYPRTPDTVIGGFMKLAGQADVWAKMQEANAVPRAWAWFQTAMEELGGFVREIPALFIKALKSLELTDIILLPLAFVKVGKVFADFVGRFISWALNTAWKLLEIVFDVVSPGAWGYIQRTGAALKSILKNPLPFVGNLVAAAKAGFMGFAGNFLQHLKAGLIEWLTGSLPGVYIPTAFTLQEIVKFVFSVLGLTWANIRQKLVKATSETVVSAMEKGFDIVVTLVTKGPAAAWDKIKEQLANLKDMVIGGITDLVVDAVVKKAIPKLIAMFIPGAGFISAIISIYETVMVFVQKISKIVQVVTAFVNSIVAIAAGQIGAAAARVESILAGLLSLAISFLAGFAGLGNVASKIMGVIQKIRAPIDKALDWLINWIVTMAKKLFAKAFGKNKDDNRTDADKARDLAAAKAEANQVMAAEHPSEKKVIRRLDPIKKKYKLTSLQVVQDAKTERQVKYHVRLVINPQADTEALVDPTRLNEIVVSPKFKFRSSPGRNSKGEFDRQLKLQQATMNNMDVQKWLKNRAAWTAAAAGRSTEGTKKQADVLENERQAFRTRAIAERTAAYKANGLADAIAAGKALVFVNRLLERVLLPTNRSKYKHQMLADDFGTKVENEMWRKVALHALDQVAGGEGTVVVGVGGESEDKSIGRQWVSEPRIDNIERAAKAQVTAFKLTPENLASVNMHVTLVPFDEV